LSRVTTITLASGRSAQATGNAGTARSRMFLSVESSSRVGRREIGVSTRSPTNVGDGHPASMGQHSRGLLRLGPSLGRLGKLVRGFAALVEAPERSFVEAVREDLHGADDSVASVTDAAGVVILRSAAF
jgi:hypothetical protein